MAALQEKCYKLTSSWHLKCISCRMNKAACSNKGRNKRKIKDKKNTVSVFKTKGRKAIMYIWHVYMTWLFGTHGVSVFEATPHTSVCTFTLCSLALKLVRTSDELHVAVIERISTKHLPWWLSFGSSFFIRQQCAQYRTGFYLFIYILWFADSST